MKTATDTPRKAIDLVYKEHGNSLLQLLISHDLVMQAIRDHIRESGPERFDKVLFIERQSKRWIADLKKLIEENT